MNIPTIAPDKALHYVWGSFAALSGLAGAALLQMLGTPAPLALGAAAVCAAAAVAREAWNYEQGGPFDWRDILATMLGCVPVLVAVLAAGGAA